MSAYLTHDNNDNKMPIMYYYVVSYIMYPFKLSNKKMIIIQIILVKNLGEILKIILPYFVQ